MPDKEVGELWQRTQDHLTWPEPLAIDHDVVALIRKLVEEALQVYQVKYGCITAIHEDAVFKRFGIDPETWK